MNRLLVSLTGLSLLIGIAATTVPPADAAAMQGKKKPAAAKKKPAPPVKKQGGPVVLGTKQLPGDFGQLGTTYTIGQRSPLNFTLKSAEYSVVPLNVGGQSMVPNANEKLLVLRYTVQNPQPRETGYSWTGLGFTAVDSKDVNHEGKGLISREGETSLLDISLKPAQKIDVVTAVLVPAEGVVPKLIVLRETGAPVIRYDLRGKAKPLPASHADPADASGATARKEVPAAAGTYHPLGMYDVKLDSVTSVAGPVGAVNPGKGNRVVAAVFSIRNRSTSNKTYSWTTFASYVRDADGEKTEANSNVLKASRDEAASGELKPGEEAKIRLLYVLPQNVAPKTISLAEGSQDPRGLVFEAPAVGQ